MKIFLLAVCLMASSLPSHADQENTTLVRRYDGKMVPVPVLGSAEAQLITPRKHPDNFQGVKTRAIDPNTRYTPHTGKPHILVILANFKDVKFKVKEPKEAFYDFFNAPGAISDRGNGNNENYGSVSQYFKAISSGTFEPVFDVYGPVDLPNNRTYYGGNNADSNSDERPRDLVRDAFNQAKHLVADADRLDANNDGYIDCIYVVYAGLGQNYGGGAETVWACTSTIYDSSLKIGNKAAYNFSIGAELYPAYIRKRVNKQDKTMQINSIGVTCHEFSHAMGLPDIYPTTSGAYVHNQEMEFWDLMDGGEYAGKGGFIPMPYTAWEKKQMNWPVDIRFLTAEGNITMDKTANDGGIVYKIANPNHAEEYFLLENINQTGWYKGASNKGLLVYKVLDYDKVNMYDHPNNTPGKPGMAVVPADGLCFSSYLIQRHGKDEANHSELNKQEKQNYMNQLKGDVFPGTSNVTKLNSDANIPNFWWYSQGDINEKTTSNPNYYKVKQALDNISISEDGKVTFRYIADYKHPTGIHSPATNAQEDHRIFTLDGRYLGTNTEKLHKGIYIINYKKIVVK